MSVSNNYDIIHKISTGTDATQASEPVAASSRKKTAFKVAALALGVFMLIATLATFICGFAGAGVFTLIPLGMAIVSAIAYFACKYIFEGEQSKERNQFELDMKKFKEEWDALNNEKSSSGTQECNDILRSKTEEEKQQFKNESLSKLNNDKEKMQKLSANAQDLLKRLLTADFIDRTVQKDLLKTAEDNLVKTITEIHEIIDVINATIELINKGDN